MLRLQCYSIDINILISFIFDSGVDRFVGGRYELICGALLENLGPILSGGIHDWYYCAIAKYLSHNTPINVTVAAERYRHLSSNKLLHTHPNVDELFDILETAVRCNNIVGTFSLDELACKSKGIICKHQYAITGVLKSKNRQIVKLHNPWNEVETITRFYCIQIATVISCD